jgi:hypothetical protein
MPVEPGDIVRVERQAGLWVVIGPAFDQMPPGYRWRVRQRDVGHTVGIDDMTLVERPEFTPGEIVKYFGYDVQVIADNGDTVRLARRYLRPANLDREQGRFTRMPTVATGEFEVGKGELTAENL